jgi:plastocyanin
MKALIACLVWMFTVSCSEALAAELQVSVRDASGHPVKDAVISFSPEQGAAIPSDLKEKPYVMAQMGMQFSPHVLIVPQGASVAFPNQDKVSHHVYSFSTTHKFQFPLYGPKLSRSERFDATGTVALGCNIHDSMRGYIRIVDTPYFALSDAAGKVTLKGVPEAKGRLEGWHPLLTAPGNLLSQSVTPQGILAVTLSMKLRREAVASEGY